MQFIKVTSNKYVGQNGYSLIKKKDESFCVCKNSQITQWGSYFKTVNAAQFFMNSHDYVAASTETIPASSSDIEFIIDYFGFQKVGRNKYAHDGVVLILTDEGDHPLLQLDLNGNHYDSNDVEQFIKILDNILSKSDVIASIIYRGSELRSIFAAKSKRSSREITKNLVRVKSSNVWAYGVEIKDAKASKGDVYVQFKGKNGGPDSVYVYYDVPLNLWRKFISAPSKGHFIWKYLRNNFLYSKLTGDKRGRLPNAIN